MVAALVLGTTSLATAPSVLASCSPNPPRTHDSQSYFAGTQRTVGSSLTGVKANIEEYQPWMGYPSQVQQWVMLTKTDLSEWAQVGWRVLRNGSGTYSRYSWWQYTYAGPGFFDGYYAAAPLGTLPTYRVEYVFNTDLGVWQFRFYRDVTQLASVTIWTGPTLAEVYGETNTRRDQMPGGTTNYNQFTGVYYRTGTSTWNPFSAAAGANDGMIHGASGSGTSYWIWDKACSS